MISFILFDFSIHIHKSFENVPVLWFSNSLPFQAAQFLVHLCASFDANFHFNAKQQAFNCRLQDLNPKLS